MCLEATCLRRSTSSCRVPCRSEKLTISGRVSAHVYFASWSLAESDTVFKAMPGSFFCRWAGCPRDFDSATRWQQTGSPGKLHPKHICLSGWLLSPVNGRTRQSLLEPTSGKPPLLPLRCPWSSVSAQTAKTYHRTRFCFRRIRRLRINFCQSNGAKPSYVFRSNKPAYASKAN